MQSVHSVIYVEVAGFLHNIILLQSSLNHL